jgi:hypothetical protein
MKTCRAVGISHSDIWSREDATANIFYSAGRVAVGHVNPPAAALDVAGNLSTDVFVSQHKYYKSDRRLKKNIVEIKNPLEKINLIRGVSFNWKSNNQHDVGLIAQEVQKQIPEIVSINSNTGYYAVEYAKLVPILIEAIKDQQTELDSLQIEISNLKK